MICVNLYGGAGVGKSTIAAFVFAELKTRGILCELVGSYQKELSYERAFRIREDEQYTFANLAHRLYRLKNFGIQVAVCDYPVLQAIVWSRAPKSNYLYNEICETYNKYDNINFVLERNTTFWEKDCRDGNISDEIVSDKKVEALLKKYNLDFEKISPEGYKTAKAIADKIEKEVKSRNWKELVTYAEKMPTGECVNRYTGEILDYSEIYQSNDRFKKIAL